MEQVPTRRPGKMLERQQGNVPARSCWSLLCRHPGDGASSPQDHSRPPPSGPLQGSQPSSPPSPPAPGLQVRPQNVPVFTEHTLHSSLGTRNRFRYLAAARCVLRLCFPLFLFTCSWTVCFTSVHCAFPLKCVYEGRKQAGCKSIAESTPWLVKSGPQLFS